LNGWGARLNGLGPEPAWFRAPAVQRFARPQARNRVIPVPARICGVHDFARLIPDGVTSRIDLTLASSASSVAR
jgi:hypothetical protein